MTSVGERHLALSSRIHEAWPSAYAGPYVHFVVWRRDIVRILFPIPRGS